MAKLTGIVQFTGSAGQLTFYKRRDLDKIIARQKGGPSREAIKKKESFINTRRVNAEFGARSTASCMIMRAILPLKRVADYNIAGPLNALLKHIQVLDTKSEWGKRNVYFTRQPKLLEGFSFNKNNPLESIVKSPIAAIASKETGIATIEIPALIPEINFTQPEGLPKYGYYRFQVAFSRFYDLDCGVRHGNALSMTHNQHIETEWMSTSQPTAARKLEMTIPLEKLENPEKFSLLVAAGICFGKPGWNGEIQQVKYAGAGKIVLMC